MTETWQPPPKIGYLLFASLLLMGHTTTAPWNSFIMNEEYFKWKLSGSPAPMAWTSKSLEEQRVKLVDCIDLTKNLTRNSTENIIENSDSKNSDSKNSGSKNSGSKSSASLPQKQEILTCYHSNSWSSSKTETQKSQESLVQFWGTTLSSVALLITFFSTLLSGYIIPKTKNYVRVEFCQILVALIFLFQIFLIYNIDTSIEQNYQQFFNLTIVSVVLVILAAVTTQCSWFAIAGPMPYNYIMTFMEGQGLGGIFISVLVIALNKIFKDPETGTWYDASSVKSFSMVYFLITVGTTVSTLLVYQLVFKKCDEYQKIYKKQESGGPETENLTEKNTPETTKSSVDQDIPMKTILKSIHKQILSTFFTFFVFLSLFPAVLTSITSEYSNADIFGIKQANWTFITYALYMLYSVGDWVGKKLGNLKPIPFEKENTLLTISFMRIPVFFILFSLCDLTGTRTGFFSTSWFFICVMTVYSVSQGYFGCIPMGIAPQVFLMKQGENYSVKQVQNAQGRIMPVMVAVLVGGLLAGALFSGVNTTLLLDLQKSEHQKFQFAKIDELF